MQSTGRQELGTGAAVADICDSPVLSRMRYGAGVWKLIVGRLGRLRAGFGRTRCVAADRHRQGKCMETDNVDGFDGHLPGWTTSSRWRGPRIHGDPLNDDRTVRRHTRALAEIDPETCSG